MHALLTVISLTDFRVTVLNKSAKHVLTRTR